MADQNDTALSTAAETAAQAPAAATAPTVPKVTEDPNWLPARLERERRSMLKELGAENVEDVKKALADLKSKQDADKSAAEKAAEYKSKLDAEQAQAASLMKTVSEHAARMMVGLTDEQKAAVIAIAGDDANAQLRTISALSPTWGKQAAAAAAAPVAAPPATTSPAPSAPNGATASPPDHKSTYSDLRSKNPFEAAAYGLAHSTDVYTPKA